MKEYIENVLAPKLQGDGGWVEFVSYENKKLTLIFRGECSKCLILNRCVDWIAQQIKEAKGELLRSLLSARSHSSGTTCDARVSKSQADHVCMRKFVTLRPECF